MKTACLVIAAMAACGLVGCASTADRALTHSTPAMMQTDAAYVAQVEKVARARGIAVTWVNAPRKRDRAAD